MFYKVKSILALSDYKLVFIFSEDIIKLYDVNPLFEKFMISNNLKEDGLFYECSVDVGGYGVSWNDDIDLLCDGLLPWRQWFVNMVSLSLDNI